MPFTLVDSLPEKFRAWAPECDGGGFQFWLGHFLAV